MWNEKEEVGSYHESTFEARKIFDNCFFLYKKKHRNSKPKNWFFFCLVLFEAKTRQRNKEEKVRSQPPIFNSNKRSWPLSLSRFLQKPTQCRQSLSRDVRLGLRPVVCFFKVYLLKYTPHLLKVKNTYVFFIEEKPLHLPRKRKPVLSWLLKYPCTRLSVLVTKRFRKG